MRESELKSNPSLDGSEQELAKLIENLSEL